MAGTIVAHERQFPTRTRLIQAYQICEACHSLCAAHPADDLSTHYPADYYAYGSLRDGAFAKYARGVRAAYQTTGASLAGRLVSAVLGVPDDLAALARLTLKRHTRVLDVGAGNGRLLKDLHYAGFESLLGADPFGPSEPGPPRLIRLSIREVNDDWDVIMYHHCLEHIEDPEAEMRSALARLAVGGRIVIRIPLADSDAFRRYRSRWVQLDAPRHRTIPTALGLAKLASRVGLRIVDAWRDSTAFQFWGSELYLRDILLQDGRHRISELFSRGQLREWTERASAANSDERGDQGAFVLERTR